MSQIVFKREKKGLNVIKFLKSDLITAHSETISSVDPERNNAMWSYPKFICKNDEVSSGFVILIQPNIGILDISTSI